MSPQILNFNIKIDVSQMQTYQSKVVVLYAGCIEKHLKSF